MSLTMEDVARRVGVSKSTVSLVLNKKLGVSPETQRVVLQAAEELGYRLPERRPLKRPSESKTLTVVHYVGQEPYTEPYGLALDFLNGTRAFVRQANANLTVIAGYRKGDIGRLGTHLLNDENTPPDGLMLMGPGVHRDSQLLLQALERNIPLVVLSRNWLDLPVSTVGQDHCQQARIALDYLIRLGHRRIAFVAGEVDKQYDWFDWRLTCYRETMTQLNGEIDEKLIALGEDGISAVRTLMTRRPDVTAIFAIHDRRAVEVLQGLWEMGLHIPQDVSVIGQDDSEQVPEDYPALTTVGFPHFEVGYLAAELLLKQIENDKILYSNILVRSYLIERASCDKAPS